MLERMSVRVEIWPLAADEIGLWLASGNDAWRSDPVRSDSEPHWEVESLLSQHEAKGSAKLIHSTSWRVDGPVVVLTYMVVLDLHSDLARDRWPEALPISLELADAVGQPPEHEPTEVPIPRYIDVLIHGVRHLRFLLDTDTSNAAALDERWREHLKTIEPALARMYDGHHGEPNA